MAYFYNPGHTDFEEFVALRIDRDNDEMFETTVEKRPVTIPPGKVVGIKFNVVGDRLEPGRYRYGVGNAEGTEYWETNVVVLEPATFEVRQMPSATVVQGQNGSVTALIANVGDYTGPGSIELRVDRNRNGIYESFERISSKTLTVTAYRNETVEFEVTTDEFDTGEYQFLVSTETAKREAVLTVQRPPTFRVSTVRVPGSVVRGTPLNLSVTVTNIGDVAGRRAVTLSGVEGQDNRSESRYLAPGSRGSIEFVVETSNLTRGELTFQLATRSQSVQESVMILRPATLDLDVVEAPGVVNRGRAFNLTIALNNIGDVAGNGTVSLSGPEGTTNRTVTLGAGDSTTVNVTLDTSNLTRGNYSYRVTTANRSAEFQVRVRSGYFEVTRLEGSKTLYLGDDLSFKARVMNVGDATETQLIELKLDLDGDDIPESYGIDQPLTLAPGEQASISFTAFGGDGPTSTIARSDLIGSHVFGVFTENSNRTSVFAVKVRSGSSSRSSASTTTSSRDEISQDKYGLYYRQLSAETKIQVDEIHQRQPFADNLVITEVLTREELARDRYGIDVDPGEPFNFSAIDVEIQQQIEMDFDAQFESEDGDRIESWNELAQAKYDTSFDELSEHQKDTIREEYRKRLDDD